MKQIIILFFSIVSFSIIALDPKFISQDKLIIGKSGDNPTISNKDGSYQIRLNSSEQALQESIDGGNNWNVIKGGGGGLGTIAPVTDWTAYTPTFQGFGTPTDVEIRYRRVGDSIEIQGRFTSGTATTDEARIGLPSGLQISTDVQTRDIVGQYDRNLAETSIVEYLILASPSDTFLNVSRRSATNSPFSPRLGTEVGAASQVSGFFATVPIQGWTTGLDAAASVIELDATTANQFAVRVNSDGTVVGDDYGVISSCTNDGTGLYSCSFNSGIFTSAPAVVLSSLGATNGDVKIDFRNDLPTTSGFQYACHRVTSTLENCLAQVVISRSGDVNKSQVIAGTFEQIQTTEISTVTQAGAGTQTLGIGATEAVGISNGTTEVITGNITTSSNKVFINADGDYIISGGCGFSGAINAAGERLRCWIRKNGTDSLVNTSMTGVTDGTQTVPLPSKLVTLEDGDYLELMATNDDSKVHAIATNGDNTFISVVEYYDKKALIKNLNDANNVTCQTKSLSSSFSGTGVVSDLTFNNLDTTRCHSITLREVVRNTSTAVIDHITVFEYGSGTDIKATRSSFQNNNTLDNAKVGIDYTFLPSESTVQFRVTTAVNSLLTSSATLGTYATLCEMPANYICSGSTKFD